MIKTVKALWIQYFNSLCQKGWLGKNRQLLFYFGKPLKHSDIEKKRLNIEIERINENYTGVRVWHNKYAHRIGEYLSRYLMLTRFIEENNDGYLNVMFDSNYDKGNKALSKIIGRKIFSINSDNIGEWIYILRRVKRVDFSRFDSLKDRYVDTRIYTSEWCKDKLPLSKEELLYCENKMKIMELKEPYVCFFNRDSEYLNKSMPERDWSYHDHRDSHIETRFAAIDYLKSQGIHSVRVGKAASTKCEYGGCIDYCFNYREDIMDVFIHSRAKFVVGDSCGINLIPLINNGHVVITNFTPLSHGMGAVPSEFEGVVLFKKMFDMKKDRFLSLHEMVEMERICDDNANLYAKHNIILIENSEEEICDATIEMNERIDGNWIETKMDLERQSAFSDFEKMIAKKYRIPDGDYIHTRIGARFLEKNWSIFRI